MKGKYYLQFKNNSSPEVLKDKEFNFIVGFMFQAELDLYDVHLSRLAMFVQTKWRRLIFYRRQIQIKNQFVFGVGDVFTLVLDLNQNKIEWYLNDDLLIDLDVDEDILDYRYYPFISYTNPECKIGVL